MRFHRLSPNVLAYVAMTILLAFLGAEILAGQSSLGERSQNSVSSQMRDRPPRFVVHLRLEEAGIQGSFNEVSGLGSVNDVVEFRDGSDPNIVRKLPGALDWPDITLKRGITDDTSLWRWRRLVESGNVADARTNGKLTLLDRGAPVATWRFVNAWPAKISGPQLNGEGNDIAIEELVIAHEGMTRE